MLVLTIIARLYLAAVVLLALGLAAIGPARAIRDAHRRGLARIAADGRPARVDASNVRVIR